MPEPVVGSQERLQICTLASGSKGNSIYISDGRTRLLVDAGLSAAEIRRRMHAVDLDPGRLDGLIVSHEHSDHTQGIGVLSRRYQLPVYLTRATLAAANRLGRLHEHHHFRCGETFRLNTLKIHPFSITHDARDPAGFRISRPGKQIGIATDMGKATTMVADHLSQCNLIVLEANHDLKMLADGPYPWHLKQRIRSRNGHLSNLESKDLLARIQHSNLKYVILAHLSETNNTAEAALSEFASVIAASGVRVIVAEQHRPGPLLSI
jgi:phosphoribosyl 1,2-cyclic phosphodiesterase